MLVSNPRCVATNYVKVFSRQHRRQTQQGLKMLHPRMECLVALVDNVIYAIGGSTAILGNPASPKPSYQRDAGVRFVEKLNLRSKPLKWEKCRSISKPRGALAGGVIDGVIYAVSLSL